MSIRVLAAVIERNGRYLVGRRPAHKRHGGLWEFPGGKVEAGESDRDALARELDEELGLTLTGIGAERFERADPGSPYRIVFRNAAVRGEPVAHEHVALAWATPTELRGMALAPSDAAFAATLLAELG